ncbi:DUF4149 domain-containing protein [Ramlibacter aurantiacus]|uniref:DUF4149 domain-containing protein n=1 Tax=Ramlibacter aurantiacus TaxID=2801330 RepID=UPI001F1ABB9C|nr:DUF4149 domain-containing protein [Ramlibacter aurantiacus]
MFSAALWWGGLTGIAFISVPLLFAYLPSATIAGGMAARLFTAQAWLALACGLLLLLCAREEPTSAMRWAGGALAFVLLGMLLALLTEFGVSPRIVARENLRLWHALGSAMMALQWVCAAVVLWKLGGARPAA